MTIARRVHRNAPVSVVAWLVFSLPLHLTMSTTALGQVKGDLNDNGQVEIGDGVLESRIVGGYVSPTILADESVADVAPMVNGAGGDGLLGPNDIVVMMRGLSGIDVDADGLSLAEENAIGTSPFLADTDGDGLPDPTDPEPLIPDTPGVPGNLRVLDGTANVTLTFTAPLGPIDSYIIHRYGTDGEYTFFSADSGATSFLDDTAQSGQVYFYWVQAVQPDGDEGTFVNCDIQDPDNSNLWLAGAIGPLPNPHSTAKVTGGNDVDLTWEPSGNPSVIGYRVYQSSVPVPLGSTTGLSLVQTLNGIGTTNHSIPGLATGTYYFRVTAFSGSVESLLESAKQSVVVVP